MKESVVTSKAEALQLAIVSKSGVIKILDTVQLAGLKLKAGDKLRVLKKGKEEAFEDLIVIKNGENLEIVYADGSSMTLERFYALDNIALELPTSEYEMHMLSSNVESGSELNIVYAQGDVSSFSAMFESNDAMLQAFNNYNTSIDSGLNAAGEAAAAGAAEGAAGSAGAAAGTAGGMFAGVSTATLVAGGVVAAGVVAAAASSGSSGGGSSSSPSGPSEEGNLVDSPIIGATYERYTGYGTPSETLVGRGTTGKEGSFVYNPNETIVFKIGNVTLGSIDASEMPVDGYVMPQDIIGVSRDLNGATPEQLAKVLQMAIFLQTLDAVGNANDGTIVINSDSLGLIDPNAPSLSFEDGLTAGDALNEIAVTNAGKTVVNVLDALKHLSDTVTDLTGGTVNQAPIVTGSANLGSFTETNAILTTTGDIADLLTGVVTDDGGNAGLSLIDGTYIGTYGTLIISGDTYTYTINASNQTIADGTTENDTFSLQVTDGTHVTQMNVTATITGVNSDPEANDDTIAATVYENGTLAITFSNVLSNDSDIDGELTITSVQTTSDKGATVSLATSGNNGGDKSADLVFVIDDSGSMSYIYDTLTSKLQDIVTALNDAGKTDLTFGLVRYGHSGVTPVTIDLDGNGAITTNDYQDIKNAIDGIFDVSGSTENALSAVQTSIDDFADIFTSSSKNIILVTDENADDYSQNLYDTTLANLIQEGFVVHAIYNPSDSTGVLNLAQATGGATISVNDANWGETLATSLTEAITQTITYEANGDIIEALGEGETLEDTFTYTVADEEGAESTATVTVTVTGVNDAAIIDANSTSVVTEVTEDGSLTVSGLATHTDVDNNNSDNVFQEVTNIESTYGTYTVDVDGNWTYTLDNANVNVQALNEGEILTDNIIITAEDGTTEKLTITINGKNEGPGITESQISTVTLSGVVEAGDTYTLTINEVTKTYIANGTETINDIAANLTNQMNNDNTINVNVTLVSLGAVITVTPIIATNTFTITASATNGIAGNDDSTSTITVVTENVEEVLAVKQEETVTLEGTPEMGDTYSITINGNTVTYTSNGTETIEDIAISLTTQMNAISNDVTLTVLGAVITVKADVAGTPFTLSATGANGLEGADDSSILVSTDESSNIEKATINLGLDEFQPDDVIVITVNGTEYSYTVNAGDTIDSIGNALATQVDANLAVSAVYDLNTNTITITGTDANSNYSFTLESNVQNITYNNNVVPDAVSVDGTPAVAQVTTLDLGEDDYYAGDTVTVIVGSNQYNYTVQVNNSISDIATALASLIDADNDVNATSTNGIITITGAVAGNGIQIASSSTDITLTNNSISSNDTQSAVAADEGTAKVVSVSFSDTTVTVGETYTISIANESELPQVFSYTAQAGNTMTFVLNKLVTDINANLAVDVTAVRSGSNIFITADSAGNDFTVSASDGQNSQVVATLTPNEDPGVSVSQISEVNLGGTEFNAGDVVSVTLNGINYSYTVSNGDDIDTIGSALQADIDVDYTASYDANTNIITIEGTSGVAFTVNASVENFINVENQQTLTLTTPADNAVAQEVTIDFTGLTYDVGDIVKVTVHGEATYSYTVSGTDTASDIASELATLISNANGIFTANASGDVITLTGLTNGTNTLVTTSITNFGINDTVVAEPTVIDNVEYVAPVKEVQTVTYEETDVLDIGDQYVLDINNTQITYAVSGTESDMAEVVSNIATLINSNGTLAYATVNGTVLTLTALTAGTAIGTVTSTITNAAAGTDDNGILATETQANVTINAQVDTVTLDADNYDAGDVVRVTIDGTNYDYTVTVNGTTADTIGAQLVLDINVGATAAKAQASYANGVITITQETLDIGNGSYVVASGLNAEASTTENADASIVELSHKDGEAINAQVDTVTLDADNYDAGDVVRVTINGTDYDYTVTVNGTTADTIGAQLVSDINVGATAAKAQASYANGVITITQETLDIGNGSYVVASGLNVEASTTEDADASIVTLAHIDGEAVNAQVDTVTLDADNYDAGDVVRVTIDGTNYDYTVTVNGTTADTIGAQLVNDINVGATAAKAQASYENGVITITQETADIANGLYVVASGLNAETGVVVDNEVTAKVQQAAGSETLAAVAQVSTVNYTNAVLDVHDEYSVTVNGTQYTYTVSSEFATMTTVLNNLITQINNGVESSNVTASRSGSTLIIASDVAGTAFTISASTTDAQASANVATPTPNAEAELPQPEITNVNFGLANTMFDVGDTISLSIKGVEIMNVTLDAAANADTIINVIIATAGDTSAAGYTLLNDGNGTLVVTGLNDGEDLNVVSSVVDYELTTNTAELNVEGVEEANVQTATEQYDEVAITGAMNIGDQFTITLNGTEYTVTVNGTTISTATEVAAAFVTELNGTNGITVANTAGVVEFTGINGTAFEVSSSATDYVATLNTAELNGEGVDEANVQTATEQYDEVAITGAMDIGDQFTITLNGTEYTVTVNGTTISTATEVAAAFVTELNGTDGVTVTNTLGVVEFKGAADGTAFTVSSSATDYVATTNTAELNVEGVEEANIATPTAQETTIAFNAVNTIEQGDEFSVSVSVNGGQAIEAVHTTAADDTWYGILDTLGASIEAQTSGAVTYTIDVANAGLVASDFSLVLTSAVDGTPFTVSEMVTNRAVGTENTEAIIDTTVENVEEVIAVGQSVTYDLSEQTFDAGDIITVTVDGNEINYTVTGNEGSTSAIIDAVVTAINDFATPSLVVTASNNQNDLVLSADVIGTEFTYDLTVTDIALSENTIVQTATQESTAVITTGTIEIGDVYTVNVGSLTATYTTDGNEIVNDITSELLDQLQVADTNNDYTISLIESVPTSGNYDTIRVIANNVGTAFTMTATVVNRAAAVTDDNNASAELVDGNVESVTPVAQEESISFVVGTFEAGDVYSVTLGAYTATMILAGDEVINDITATLKDDLIAADVDNDYTITVAESVPASGNFDMINVVANTAGTPFELAATVTNREDAITYDNEVTIGDAINLSTISSGDTVDMSEGDDTLIIDVVGSHDIGVILADITLLNFENIDLSNGDYTLENITADDVLSITDSNNVLNILNQSGDSINLSGWTQDAVDTTVYTATATGGQTVTINVETNDGVVLSV